MVMQIKLIVVVVVDGQEQKHLSSLETKLCFHVNSSTINSIVLTPNMAALSRGCRPRIWPVLSPSLNQASTVFVIETFHCLMKPGAIMGVGDRKRGVQRGFIEIAKWAILRTNCTTLNVVNSRGNPWVCAESRAELLLTFCPPFPRKFFCLFLLNGIYSSHHISGISSSQDLSKTLSLRCTVDSLLTDTSIRLTLRVGPFPFFTPFIWLSIRRTSLLRQTLTAGP